MSCRAVQCFLVRKLMEHELEAAGLGADEAYFCSLSSRTIVYKGQLKPDQVRAAVRTPSNFAELYPDRPIKASRQPTTSIRSSTCGVRGLSL